MSTLHKAEQLSEGPGNGGIAKSASEPKKNTAEQLSEGPGNGGIAKSAVGRQGTKRKLDQKTLETKYNAILEVEKGQKSKSEVAKMFGVPKNTLTGWIKKAESIKEGFAKYGPKRRNMRLGDHEEMEAALLRWFTEMRTKDVPLSGPMLLQKASFFAEQLGVSDFKQSTGWLDRFKERHGITFKKVCGEAKSVDTHSADMESWSVRLSALLRAYQPRDIYNADETALFYKLTSDKTMEFKNVTCSGGKRSKERITLMVCSNMTGDDKVPLTVIGKYGKPRCFKNVNTLPTGYEYNTKAWMTSDLFTKWLQKLDRRFQREQRKVAMVVDNCPAHPKVKGLKSIELVFLPPNTTSHTQPMDQGIIKNLKVQYRRQVIMKQLDAADRNAEFQLSLLDAMRILQKSWCNVTTETISNCYRHAGFTTEEQSPEVVSDEDDDDNIPLSRLARMQSVDFRSYIDVDREIPTCSLTSDEDIISDIVSARNDCESSAEPECDDDDSEPVPVPTVSDVLRYSEEISRFFEAHAGTEKELNLMCVVHRSLLKYDFKKRTAVQPTIRDFFKK